MVGNYGENIFVEFDYNNISIVDPNRVIDDNGVVRERHLRQENLVMYANLECKLIPRTKLVLGTSYTDIQQVSLASINFLKQQDKEFFDNSYTDEFTGKDTLEGKGSNQVNYSTVPPSNLTKSNLPKDYYIQKSINTGGKPGSVNNGLLGIKSISVRMGMSFTPQIDVVLEDVKGRALFELGDNSPYAAFFNLPYPKFELTLKGFLGKAVKYNLMLQTFKASFEGSTGNFIINLKFLPYKYTILSEVSFGAAISLPHMYQTSVTTTSNNNTNTGGKEVSYTTTSAGIEKLKEVYSEYKSKGLMDDNVKELTIMELRSNIDRFGTNILNNFTKQNLTPLSEVKKYTNNLNNFNLEIYKGDEKTAWFKIYTDQKNYFILNDGTKIFTLKDGFRTSEKISEANTKLSAIVNNYKTTLSKNPVLGTNGTYEIVGKSKKTISSSISQIDFITTEIFNVNIPDLTKVINTKETARQRLGIKTEPTKADIDKINSEISALQLTNIKLVQNPQTGKIEQQNTNLFYILNSVEGSLLNNAEVNLPAKTFVSVTNDISLSIKKIKEQIENDLTNALADYLKSTGSEGLGFVPTLRNVLGIFYANTEAFLRLMDDVHTKAWQVRGDKNRRAAVLDPQTKSGNPDYLEGDDTPIYPWPNFVVPAKGQDGQEIYNFKYPGDKDYISRTKANDFSIWPEVEFIEEFIKALTQTQEEVKTPPVLGDDVTDVKRIGINAIEFPISNQVYQNKEVTKFIYEIWERIYLVSYFSKISRIVGTDDYTKLLGTLVSMEVENLKNTLGENSPFLTQALKNYQISSDNINQILSTISNQGQGQSYQNFIRGEFNTPYIRNILQNSQSRFLESSELQQPSSSPVTSVDLQPIENYITGSTSSNDFEIVDLQPFVAQTWTKKYLANGKNLNSVKSAFNTKNTLFYLNTNKIISNFTYNQKNTENRPITNFNFENGMQNVPRIRSVNDISDFYEDRPFKDQLVTEGNLRYYDYSGKVSSNQTTSILNSPFFVNAIQEGVKNSLTGSTFPYISAAYLFLNSLPVATLKETYKTLENKEVKSSGYIFASLKKYAALHKLPYAFILKLGSIWYRYKTYVTSQIDILDNCWKNFDYAENFDPTNKDITKIYQLTENNINYDIVLEKDTTFGEDSYTSINLGFYPKTINDFNYFLRGSVLFTAYTSNDIQNEIAVTGLTATTKSGLKFFFPQSSSISRTSGFDSKNLKRNLGITSWSCSVHDSIENVDYVLPSVGSFKNQTEIECFNSGQKMNQEVSGNTSMYNGSVRLFWTAPQFGYFDVQKVSKPEYNEYLKFVFSAQTEQENFSINGQDIQYSKIDELFAVFDKNTLDLFANEFLNFCRSENTLVLNPTSADTQTTTAKNNELSFGYTNFQILMKNLLATRNVTGATTTELLESYQNQSFKNISSIMKSFLTYDKIFLFGNPSFFDRKIFTSFSHKFIVDGSKWKYYNEITPNALPSKNGSVTLLTSQANYPTEWVDLQLYVGFSEITELKYKDSSDGGSFITDFFIDFNMAFTSENIKKYSTIIKIYATQKLQQYLNNPTPPIPVPPTKKNLMLVSTLSGGSVVNVYRTNGKKIALISDIGGKVIYTSPKTVELSPEELTVQSLQTFYGANAQLYPIISSALTQNFEYTEGPTTGNFESIELFKTTMDGFLDKSEKLKNDIINQVFQNLNKTLPDTDSAVEQKIKSVSQGEQSKYDLYETFKAVNDKWISGNDFKIKTLFEDVLLVDRASKNIGDKVFVDVFKLKGYLSKPNVNMNMLTLIRTIIMDNNFVIMDLPSYVNFYNVQDVVKNPVPKPEGTLTFGNTLFGTFLDVDYRESSAKMVCFYGGKSSEHLNTPNNSSSRYKDDSFNIRRASDNPLTENLTGKKDWGLSNKVVAFNVDIGPQEQSIFFGMNVGMNSGQATAESLQVQFDMRNQASGVQAASQSVGLYNLYKTRSYTCDLSMIGNALIQPTMYFNLRYVPMFAGPYMIQSVNHNISAGRFDTRIEGIRQPLASLPLPTDYLQSLKQNLLSKIDEAIKQVDESNKLTSNNNITNTSNTATKVLDKIINPVTASCSTSKYPKSKPVEDTLAPTNKANFTEVLTSVKQNVENVAGLNIVSQEKLKQLVFGSLFLTSVNSSKTGIEAYYNNFAAIDLDSDWGQVGNTFFDKQSPDRHICLKTQNGSIKPYAIFENLENNISFLVARWNKKLTALESDIKGNITKESLIKFWVTYSNSDQKEGEKQYNALSPTEKANMETKAELALNKYKSLPQ